MPEWKELHLAKNIKDLKSQSTGQIDWGKMKKTSEILLMKSLEKIYDFYLENKEKRDLELSFLYLYKFFEIFAFLQARTKDKKYLHIMFAKQMNSLGDLEDFDQLLRSRYEELEKLEKEKSVKTEKLEKENSKRTEKLENEKSIKTNGIDLCNKSNEIPVFKQKNKDPEYGNKIEDITDIFIDCKQLWDLIYSSRLSNVLIMDVRSEEEFQSKVKSENTINIPSNIIKPGVSAAQLEYRLPELSRNLWKQRGHFENIVLLDSNTNRDKYKENTPIFLMRAILTMWDYPKKYKNPPLILNDGFNAWFEAYPDDTVNPVLFSTLKSSLAKPTTVSLSSIEYPDSDEESKKQDKIISKINSLVNVPAVPSQPVTDIVSQPVLPVPSTIIPRFDRSSKPNLENKSGLDKSKSRKPLQNITDSPPHVDIEKEEPVVNNVPADHSNEAKSLPAQRHSPDPDSILHNKENFSPANRNIESSREEWKVDSEIKYVGLKSDTNITAGSPSLKKSLSSPNISKLDDNMEVLIPKASPFFDRSNKPSYLTKIDSPHHGYQEKQYRISSQGELEGAVMGANIVRGLTGLKNLGNTCYMNSILQCISNTAVLRDELCRFNASENLKNKSKTEGLIAREIQKVIRILWLGNIKYFSCFDLKTVVGKFRNSFKGSEQQDSHEFFTILMDWLHEDLNEPSPSGELLGAEDSTGEKAWGEFRRNNNSIVLDLFYGQQKSTVRCNECGKQSATFEPFSNLSLLLPTSEDSCTLYDCLNLYLKEEFISGWNCPKCKSPQNATKKVDITRLPPVLVIHFKRFTSNGWCRKKQTYVNFPVNPLDMREYTAKGSEQRNESYSLYAVSNHYGTMESGHYTAYCLNTELNRWYKFDDQDVSDISVSDVKTSAAYILFYSVKR